jgi:hypothetical protein
MCGCLQATCAKTDCCHGVQPAMLEPGGLSHRPTNALSNNLKQALFTQWLRLIAGCVGSRGASAPPALCLQASKVCHCCNRCCCHRSLPQPKLAAVQVLLAPPASAQGGCCRCCCCCYCISSVRLLTQLSLTVSDTSVDVHVPQAEGRVLTASDFFIIEDDPPAVLQGMTQQR